MTLRSNGEDESSSPDSDYVKNKLLERRIILIDTDVTTETASDWVGRITLLDLEEPISEKRKPILLFVNSFGGEVEPAMGLVSIIKASKSAIYTICIGTAQSMGAVILAAGKKRYAVPNAQIMLHQHWQNTNGEMTHSELVNEAEASKKVYSQLLDYYAEVTNLDKNKLRRVLSKDTFITAQEALEMELIDAIGWKLHQWIR